MLVLVAEQSLVTGDEGQQTVAAQKEGSSEPSTLGRSHVGRDRAGRIEAPRLLQETNNQVVPAH